MSSGVFGGKVPQDKKKNSTEDLPDFSFGADDFENPTQPLDDISSTSQGDTTPQEDPFA